MPIKEITPVILKVKPKRQITSIQPRPGLEKPESSTINSFLVRIETSDGNVGYGESMCTFAAMGAQVHTGQLLARIIEELIEPFLHGKEPSECQNIYWKVTNTLGFDIGGGLITQALSAIDIALWDLYGKTVGEPICELLGGKKRSSGKIYASKITGMSNHGDKESYSRSLDEVLKAGIRGIKIGGGLGLKNDVESVRFTRERAGDDFSIMLDAYGAYSVNDSFKLAEMLKPYNIEWLEAPTDPYDNRGNISLGLDSGSKIALDPIINRWNYRDILLSGARSVGLVDVTRDGGISEFVEYAKVADVLGGELSTHSGWAVTSVGVAASAQIAAAFNGVGFMEYRLQYDDNPLGNNILKNPMKLENGKLIFPDGPGLGIDIDESRLNVLIDENKHKQ